MRGNNSEIIRRNLENFHINRVDKEAYLKEKKHHKEKPKSQKPHNFKPFHYEHISETPLKMEIPQGEELRCPHYHQKKRGVCNKLLCVGKPSKEPQEFKCPNCGQKTVFQRI